METDFIKLIETRRSIRSYKKEPVSEKDLNKLLEAGTYAPTGGGRQSPTIVAVTSSKYREKITELNEKVRKTSNDPYYGAPVVILVLADGNKRTSVIFANHILIPNGAGLVVIPEDKTNEYKKLLTDYYEKDDSKKIIDFLYKYCLTSV